MAAVWPDGGRQVAGKVRPLMLTELKQTGVSQFQQVVSKTKEWSSRRRRFQFAAHLVSDAGFESLSLQKRFWLDQNSRSRRRNFVLLEQIRGQREPGFRQFLIFLFSLLICLREICNTCTSGG